MERLTIHHIGFDTPDVLLLCLSGELDARNITKLCEEVTEALKAGRLNLLLDLTDISECDSSTVYTLLGIQQAVQRANGSLTVVAASPPVQQALLLAPTPRSRTRRSPGAGPSRTQEPCGIRAR